MTREEILARFDTPSYLKRISLQKENAVYQNKIKANNKIIAALRNSEDKEGDIAANKLDKDFPEWRRVLVKELKK